MFINKVVLIEEIMFTAKLTLFQENNIVELACRSPNQSAVTPVQLRISA